MCVHTHNLTFSFVYSGVTGHLGSFHVLAITNSAAVSVRVYLSFQIRVCIFSGHMPRSGVGGSRACLVTQSCLTLCDPLDYSLPVSSVQGIFQARVLEWVAIPSSKGSFQSRDRTRLMLSYQLSSKLRDLQTQMGCFRQRPSESQKIESCWPEAPF